MWLDNLKELKKKTNMSAKQIADMTDLPERTVSRIFSGDTEAPRVDTLRRIVAVLGGSLDDLFAESGSVVANADSIAQQEEINRLKNVTEVFQFENASLKDKNALLEAEIDRLRLILVHKEEVVSLQNEIIKLYKSQADNTELK